MEEQEKPFCEAGYGALVKRIDRSGAGRITFLDFRNFLYTKKDDYKVAGIEKHAVRHLFNQEKPQDKDEVVTKPKYSSYFDSVMQNNQERVKNKPEEVPQTDILGSFLVRPDKNNASHSQMAPLNIKTATFYDSPHVKNIATMEVVEEDYVQPTYKPSAKSNQGSSKKLFQPPPTQPEITPISTFASNDIDTSVDNRESLRATKALENRRKEVREHLYKKFQLEDKPVSSSEQDKNLRTQNSPPHMRKSSDREFVKEMTPVKPNNQNNDIRATSSNEVLRSAVEKQVKDVAGKYVFGEYAQTLTRHSQRRSSGDLTVREDVDSYMNSPGWRRQSTNQDYQTIGLTSGRPRQQDTAQDSMSWLYNTAANFQAKDSARSEHRFETTPLRHYNPTPASDGQSAKQPSDYIDSYEQYQKRKLASYNQQQSASKPFQTTDTQPMTRFNNSDRAPFAPQGHHSQTPLRALQLPRAQTAPRHNNEQQLLPAYSSTKPFNSQLTHDTNPTGIQQSSHYQHKYATPAKASSIYSQSQFQSNEDNKRGQTNYSGVFSTFGGLKDQTATVQSNYITGRRLPLVDHQGNAHNPQIKSQQTYTSPYSSGIHASHTHNYYSNLSRPQLSSNIGSINPQASSRDANTSARFPLQQEASVRSSAPLGSAQLREKYKDLLGDSTVMQPHLIQPASFSQQVPSEPSRASPTLTIDSKGNTLIREYKMGAQNYTSTWNNSNDNNNEPFEF